MKKPLIPLSIILLVSPLFACNSQKGTSSKTYISYGSLYDQSATLISQTELDKKVANEESFLLAMSPGDEKDVHCSCWRTFSSIIDNFVKEHTPIVYKCSVWFAEKYGVTPPDVGHDAPFTGSAMEASEKFRKPAIGTKMRGLVEQNNDLSVLDSILRQYQDEEILEPEVTTERSFFPFLQVAPR